MEKREFKSYTGGEVQTAGGQTVQFTCAIDEREKVAAFLAAHVRDIDVPTTGTVNVAHGSFGRYTRYDVTQHKYAGYGTTYGGYIEVLEIKNPPDGRNGFVILDYRSHVGSVFSEWESLADALSAFEKFWETSGRKHDAWQELGCQRFVPCGALTPWFYAVGDQVLIGDYAFPEGMQDDPTYRAGEKFLVCLSMDDVPSIKTCLGTRYISGDYGDSPHHRQPWFQRWVHWDDGSVTVFEGENGVRGGGWIRPLVEGEAWVTEAIHQFRHLLSGQTERFSISFSDGTQFIGRIAPAKAPPNLRRAGQYYAAVRVFGEKSIKKGVFDFSPTSEFPDAAAYVRAKFSEQGKRIEILKIRCNLVPGKKWHGVFFGRSGT